MARNRGKTSDAGEILRRRYVEGQPEMAALVRKERAKADVAQQLFDLRSRAGLTQKGLADLIGTTASVICRLEDADYEGHSLGMLYRIADALQSAVEIRFVPLGSKPPAAGLKTAKKKAPSSDPPRSLPVQSD